jgi:F5/8 type C domain
VPAWGATRLTYKAVMPNIPGECQLKATLLKTPDGNVSSLRDFTVFTPELFVVRNGIAVGKPSAASSSMKTCPPGAAVDGTLATCWEANPGSTEPQWLAVDLVSTVMVGRVELAWGKGYAKSYTIQVSSDGKTWSNVYTTTSGKGGTETIPFTPIASQWVRFYGTERADKDGCRIREFRVFEK